MHVQIFIGDRAVQEQVGRAVKSGRAAVKPESKGSSEEGECPDLRPPQPQEAWQEGRWGQGGRGGGEGRRVWRQCQLQTRPVCPGSQPAVVLLTCSVMGAAERGGAFQVTAAGAALWMATTCIFTTVTPLCVDILLLRQMSLDSLQEGSFFSDGEVTCPPGQHCQGLGE